MTSYVEVVKQLVLKVGFSKDCRGYHIRPHKIHSMSLPGKGSLNSSIGVVVGVSLHAKSLLCR